MLDSGKMFTVALRMMLYSKVRTLMALLGVVFAVSLIFAQVGIYLGMMESSSIIIDHTPGDIWVTSKNSRNFDFAQPVPEYLHYRVQAVPGVQWAEKLIVAWSVMRQKDGGNEQVEIVGYNPDTGIGAPWNMRTGSACDVKNGNFAIVDESAMKRLGSMEVGDYRDISRKRVQIIGISEGIRSFTTAPIVFMNYSLAQRLIPYVGPDSTVFIIVKVLPGHTISSVVDSLKRNIEGIDVFSRGDFSYKTRKYWTIETGAGFSFLLTIIISFFIGMLIVGQTIYNSTTEHLKEYGTMKALGAENRDIFRIIFSQAILTALIGYLVSSAVTLASAKLYDAIGMKLVVNWQVNLGILVVTMVMCLMATLLSLRKIRLIDPAILFRG
ncbi:MAG TPA: ABC transporter permease [Dissulfurispiraceae bacterium]|nr:ABC transporter permease [Dissulfurispiraceae bacterium]